MKKETVWIQEPYLSGYVYCEHRNRVVQLVKRHKEILYVLLNNRPEKGKNYLNVLRNSNTI